MPRNKKSSGSKAGSKSARKQSSRREPVLKAPAAEAPLQGRVIERPDGFYWEKSKSESYGPFATLVEAEAEMLAGGEADAAEAGDTLQEAESELGISEWIDPDTGGPAEDNVPRLEDH